MISGAILFSFFIYCPLLFSVNVCALLFIIVLKLPLCFLKLYEVVRENLENHFGNFMFSFFRYNSFIKPQPGTKRAPVIEWFSALCFDFCSAMSGLLNVSSLLYSTYWFSVLNTGILLFCCRSSFDFSDKINNAIYFNSFSKLLLILDFNCETRECIFQSGQRSGNKLKLIACNLKDIAYDACMRFCFLKKRLLLGAVRP